MTKIFRLPLPGALEGAEAHYPLKGWSALLSLLA